MCGKEILETFLSPVCSSVLFLLGMQLRIRVDVTRSLNVNNHFLLIAFLVCEVTERVDPSVSQGRKDPVDEDKTMAAYLNAWAT